MSCILDDENDFMYNVMKNMSEEELNSYLDSLECEIDYEYEDNRKRRGKKNGK